VVGGEGWEGVEGGRGMWELRSGQGLSEGQVASRARGW
jgi:hypothetical protein